MEVPFDPIALFQDLRVLSAVSSSPLEFRTSSDRLNQAAHVLACDISVRECMERLSPMLWEGLLNSWNALISNMNCISESDLRNSVICISRFTRNIVAGIPANQMHVFVCEPAIRAMAHRYTSYFALQDSQSFMVSRILMQTLSNLVTSNESLLQRLWPLYLSLPEDQNIVLRMLSHPDDGTMVAVLMFILNCVSDSPERMRNLLHLGVGPSVCIRVLDMLAKEVEERANIEPAENFTLGWKIFKMLVENGFTASLVSVTTIKEEIVTPHQTTLLKILDSYIANYSAAEHVSQNKSEEAMDHSIAEVIRNLMLEFFKLAEYAERSISRSLGTPEGLSSSNVPSASNANDVAEGGFETSFSLQSLDVLLPKVCEALVVVTQCFCSACLTPRGTASLAPEAQWSTSFLKSAKSIHNVGLVDHIIDLLRLLNVFLPRIIMGKAVWSTPRPDAPSATSGTFDHEKGFNYLKRDLVRLLGIISYEDRAVQDHVRTLGGIAVVMNLCVIDERNPYLREHAVFTLRNLLHGNPGNQDVVDAIRPIGALDENAFLRELHSIGPQERGPV